MSGAEFIAVIGIGASIIQLSDACHKVLVRIRQYRGHSAFLELASQIRLFSKDVEALQDPRALAALDPDLEADVIDLLKGCRKRIQELETLIEAQIPNPDSSSFKRVANAVRSLAKDRKLKEILDELAIYQRIVTLHLARATWKNQQDILQVLSSLERATSNVHQPTPSLTSAKQFAINEFPSSPTPRKSSRQPLCALGTCGCPCHNETTRLRLLGFAAPSLHVLQCRCTQADISLDISALQRLLRFNIMLSWYKSLNVGISLKYQRFVTEGSPGMVLCRMFPSMGDPYPSFDSTRSDLMRLCSSGHIDLDDNTLILGLGIHGGYLEAALDGFTHEPSEEAQDYAIQLSLLLVKQGVSWKTPRPIDVLNDLMARAASKHSRSKLKIFLRHAPSLDIEVGQLSAASKSLVGNWLNLKSQGDQEPWDPFYLDTITSILEYESVSGCLPPLHCAVISGKLDTAILPADDLEEISLRQTDVWGHSVIHLAVLHPEILEHSIVNITRVDIEDFFGITPLMYAAAYGQATSVRSLLHHGADPFRTHRSPYHDRRLEDQNFDSWTYAAMSGSTESFAQLLEWCTPRVSYEKLRDVINRSARDCLRMDFRFRTRTPHENELNMLRYLVDIGADMGQICNHGRTLLHRIMLPEEASILLDASEYSINHQDDFGWTMTMSLATAMDTDASTMLQAIRKAVSKGASLGIPDKCGKTAIHHLLDLLNGSVVMRGRLNPTFTNPIIARKSILKAALLLHMGAEMSQADACTCHCCPDGCSIFRRFLYNNIPIEDLSGGYRGHRIRGCHSYAEEFHALPWHIELFLLLRQLGCAIDEHELAKVIYRLSAFEALEMTHTCCGDNFADIERTKSPGSSLSVAELRNRCSAQQPDLADVERDMKEVEEEEHELAVQLEWKCVEFSQCVENHQKDTWIQILAQRALAREDVAKSVIKPAQGWFSDSSSRLQRLKEEKNIVIISESIPLWIPTPHETYSHTCTYIPLRYLPDPVDPIRPFRLEIYLDAYMDTCGHDYEGLAELLPDAESRRQLARERKEVVDKFLNEIQRLRKTPPKERKWANIFEEVEEQHVKFDF